MDMRTQNIPQDFLLLSCSELHLLLPMRLRRLENEEKYITVFFPIHHERLSWTSQQ